MRSKSVSRRARRTRLNELSARRILFEPLEDRSLMAVVVPLAIDPELSSQHLLPPGYSQFEFAGGSLGAGGTLWEFALKSQEPAANLEFNLFPLSDCVPGGPNDPCATPDAAIAIYDASGNLIASANAVDSEPAIETLVASVPTGEPLVLGIFFEQPSPTSDFRLTASTGPQSLNEPVKIDPATGHFVFNADSGANTFNSPYDVDFYPLDLTNAAAVGSALILPTGLDVHANATLFRRNAIDSPWYPIQSGLDNANVHPGEPIVLGIDPPTAGNLTDGEYLLAVAPRSFDTAARSYSITLDAELLGPGTLSAGQMAAAEELPPVVPTGARTASAALNAQLIGSERLFRFVAPVDAVGSFTVATAGSNIQAILSVYGPQGNVVDVGSRLQPGLAEVLVPVVKGQVYVIRVADVGADSTGSFVVKAAVSFNPQILALDEMANDMTDPIAVSLGGADGPSFFRVQPSLSFDILSIQVDPIGASDLATRVAVRVPGLPPIVAVATAGQPLLLPVDLQGRVGPFDIMVDAASGSGDVALRVGRLDLPQYLSFDELLPAKTNLEGDLQLSDPTTASAANQSAGGFGEVSGLKFFQLLTAKNPEPTSIAAHGSGTRALLAIYRQAGSELRLMKFVLPPSGSSDVTIAEQLPSNEPYGVVAIPLDAPLDGVARSVTFDVNGPSPFGLGVAMVPDQSAPPGQFQSILSIREVILETDYDQHLWKTTLPFNILDGQRPVVTFTPFVAQDDLQVTVTVYQTDGTVLHQQTSAAPGSELQFTLGASIVDPGALKNFIDSLRGQSLLFRVEPLAGQVGDGTYTLEMTVRTTNPVPFEVGEVSWRFPGSPNNCNPDQSPDAPVVLCGGTFPTVFDSNPFDDFEPTIITDIVQNQFGYGTAEGIFTSTVAYNTGPFGNLGAIDVYRFWAINPGPVVVRTVPIDESVNTSIHVYRGVYGSQGQLKFLTEIADASDFDWFTTDRTQIDAQVIINDPDLLTYTHPNQYRTGGGAYFVVVKNEQGTTGRYRIEVDTPSFPLLGGVEPTAPTLVCDAYCQANKDPIAYTPPASGGSVAIDLKFVEEIAEFVGYYPIQLPDNHVGPFTVSSQAALLGDGHWDFDLFDAAGKSLPGTESDQEFGQFGAHLTSATFTVPDGPQTVYLRVKEANANVNASARLTVASQVSPAPFVLVPPPATLAASPVPVALPTNQFAIGSVTGSVSAIGDVRAYAFRAPAGELEITLLPDVEVGGPRLQYAVYVNGSLRNWDVTPSAGQWVDQAEQFSTRLTLPKVRQPVNTNDLGADPSAYQDVVIVIQSHSTAPVDGGFTLSVTRPTPEICADGDTLTSAPMFECAAPLPMRDRTLTIDPLTGNSTNLVQPTGLQWVQLNVPDDVTAGSVDLTVVAGGLGAVVHFELYDVAGNLVSQATGSSNLLDPAKFDLPVAGGTRYYLRVGQANSTTAQLLVTAQSALPKATTAGLGKPAATIMGFSDDFMFRADPGPDGKFEHNFNAPTKVAFWVDRPGVATFNTVLANQQNRYVALYRGNFGCSDEFCPTSGSVATLVDYTNFQDREGLINYRLTAYLEPGMYFLMSNDSSPKFSADLPDYRMHEITLDPEFGTNDSDRLRAIDKSTDYRRASDAPLDSFRTTFYHVEAPAASQEGILTFATSYTCDTEIETGDGKLSLWTTGGTNAFTELATTGRRECDTVNDIEVTAENATPYKEYYVAFHRTNLGSKVGTTTIFEVPVGGYPELVVEPLIVSPANGETRVDVTVKNIGYAPAERNFARWQANTSATPEIDQVSDVKQRTIGPRSQRTYTFYFDPTLTTDTFTYIADYDPVLSNGIVEELNETNNTGSRQLCQLSQTGNKGDCAKPAITLALADPQLDGTGGGDTVWGRYISGVYGVKSDLVFHLTDADDVTDTDQDGQTDLLRGQGQRPSRLNEPPGMSGVTYFLGPYSQAVFDDLDFGNLHATTSTNPNILTAKAIDRYGLESPEIQRTIQVVGRPGWLRDPSDIEFNKTSKRYEIDFHQEVVNYEATVEQIIGAGVPFIGDKQNQFLVELDSHTTASLNPAQPVNAPITAHVLLKILGDDVLDEIYSAGQGGNQVQVAANMAINPITLESTAAQITVGVNDLNLFNYQSPEITLFSYGISGIASLNANLYFTVDAALDAAITADLDPSIVFDPFQPPMPIGVSPPTFIQPSVTLGANVEGEVEFFGFDLASLSGGVNFTLFVTLGLDSTDTSEVINFEDIPDSLCVDVSGALGIEFGADVLGVEIWGYEKQFPSFDIASSCDDGIVTNDGNVGLQLAALVKQVVAAMSDPSALADLPDLPGEGPGEVIVGGNQPVGSLNLDPTPNLVIDPASGRGLFVQVVDSNLGDAVTAGSLAFAQRTNAAGNWTALQTLPGTAHISNPALAFTGATAASSGRPAVVVYQAVDAAGDPSALTRNQFLAGQNIRSRYFDGQTWQAEQPLTTDSLTDTNPVLTFGGPIGQTPRGVAAWTHNTSPAPIGAVGDNIGQFDRTANEIQVAFWNAATNSWLSPQSLTADATSDVNPAVFVDDAGQFYVVWLRDVGSGNVVMFSTYSGASWTAPAKLPVIGLPDGGRISSLAIGSEGPGRIDVLIAHATRPSDPNEPVISRLYNRPSTTASFATPTAIEVISENANYSHVRTLAAPDGSLVAYWQQSDGVTNEVFVSRIGPSNVGNSYWSTPVAVTSDPNIESSPSLAIDSNDAFAIVFSSDAPVDASVASSLASIASSAVASCQTTNGGIPLAGAACGVSSELLPELSFTRPLSFPLMMAAPTGSLAAAEAQIINRGLAEATVQVSFFTTNGVEQSPPLATQQLLLNPGQTYDVHQLLPVVAGDNSYCMEIDTLSSGGSELQGDADNVSCTTLTGRLDIEVTSAALAQPAHKAGGEVTVTAMLRNRSNQATGPFRVALMRNGIAGEADSEVGSLLVPGLAPLATSTVNIPWVLPDEGSRQDLVLMIVADADANIDEASEFNNSRPVNLALRPDAAMIDVMNGVQTVVPAIQATLLNHRGEDNVRVDAVISNLGNAALTKARVQLFRSYNGDSLELAGSQNLAAIQAGENVQINFTVDAWAGDNRYLVVVDPDGETVDGNLSNNFAEMTVQLAGTAELLPQYLKPFLGASPSALSLRGTVRNTGIKEARAIHVDVYSANPDLDSPASPHTAILVGSGIIESIGPLSEGEITLPVDLSKLAGLPLQQLCLVVDYGESILEQSDLNNVACTPVILSGSPRVSDVQLNQSTPRQVDSISVKFTAAMNQATVTNLSNYTLEAAGQDRNVGTPDDTIIAISQVTFDAATQTVRITPATPIKQLFRLTVSATVTDLQGRQLDGDSNGVGGDPFVATLGQGLPTLPMHNFALPYDVNADGSVAPDDALLVINRINAGTMLQSETGEPEPPFYDVDADDIVAPADALAVINYLNSELPKSMNLATAQASDAEGEPAEPALLHHVRSTGPVPSGVESQGNIVTQQAGTIAPKRASWYPVAAQHLAHDELFALLGSSGKKHHSEYSQHGRLDQLLTLLATDDVRS